MQPFDRDIEHVVRGRVATNTLNAVLPILADLEQAVDVKVMRQIKAGKGLTEQQALQAWYEKAAIVQLRERLTQMGNSGKSAAARIAPQMEATNGKA